MTKTNSRMIKHTGVTGLKVPHETHIPSVGGKMFRRTSESAGSID